MPYSCIHLIQWFIACVFHLVCLFFYFLSLCRLCLFCKELIFASNHVHCIVHCISLECVIFVKVTNLYTCIGFLIASLIGFVHATLSIDSHVLGFPIYNAFEGNRVNGLYTWVQIPWLSPLLSYKRFQSMKVKTTTPMCHQPYEFKWALWDWGIIPPWWTSHI